MPKVKCDVLNCKHNYDYLCSKHHIDVDGIDSKNKLDTRCSSYEYLKEGMFKTEFAKLENEPSVQTEVYCDVVKCVFERGQKCYADRIVIRNINSDNYKLNNSSTITHCETFESKD